MSSWNNFVCQEMKLQDCNLTTVQIQPIRNGNILFGLMILKQLPTDECDNFREELALEMF